MAESARRERDEEEDKCTVCLDAFTEPRALPCCHTFCTKCLQGLLDDVDFGKNLVCPNCRKEHTVPPEGVDGFPLDYAAKKAEEYRSFNADDEVKAPCKNCENEDTANCEPTSYCNECGGGICEDCTTAHGRMKSLRGHNFVSWEEFSCNSFRPKRVSRKCTKHKNMEIQLFCETCNQLLCSVCLINRPHDSHTKSAKTLEETTTKRKTKVVQLQETAVNRLISCEKRIRGLEEVEKGLVGYPDGLERSIVDAFDEYLSQLRTWREQLLSEARERCSEMAKGISEQQTDAVNAIEKLNAGIGFAKKALSCTEDIEVIDMSGLAINQIETTLKESDYSPLRPPLVFEKGELRLGKLREIKQGDITVNVPEFCFMDNENLIQIKFTLPVNTTPAVKVHYGSQKQRSVTVYPKATAVDACSVPFFPRCAGKHSIEVCIGGVVCSRHDDVMIVQGAPGQGSKVKPGPDWIGESLVDQVTCGIVLSVVSAAEKLPVLRADEGDEQSFQVIVQWNNGQNVTYQWGENELYELELDT